MFLHFYAVCRVHSDMIHLNSQFKFNESAEIVKLINLNDCSCFTDFLTMSNIDFCQVWKQWKRAPENPENQAK